MAHVYHWKHGWIPLDHVAALSKAKGDRERASAILSDAHGTSAGIRSRRDLAAAIKDFHNVPEGDRLQARHDLRAAAVEHHSVDLLPRGMRGLASAQLAAQDRHRRLESATSATVSVRQGIYRGESGYHIVGKDARGRKVQVFVPGSLAAAQHAADNIRHGRPAFAS